MMPTKPTGKGTQSLFEDDDILDSLLDDTKQPTRSKGARAGRLNVSSPTNNMFSRVAEEVRRDDLEASDVSEADPNDILKNLKGMDDLEADLFPSKKKLPVQTKSVCNEEPVKDSAVLDSSANLKGADEATGGEKKPKAAPSSSAQNYSDFFDADDPLADLLDDLLPDETRPEPKPRPSKPDKSVSPASASPTLRSQTTKTAKKEDKDELLDTVGFERQKGDPKKKEAPLWFSKEKSDAPQRPRTRIQDILEASASARPPTGERKDEKLPQEKNSSVKDPFVEDDLTFGSYQPTIVSAPEGRQSRRQSVRFSTEDVRVSTPEKKPQPSTSTTSRHRGSAEWLGLTANDEPDYLEEGSKATKSSAASPKAPSTPVRERKSSLTGGPSTSVAKITVDAPHSKQSGSEVTQGKRKDDEEEEEEEEEERDWLDGALSRKKALSEAKASKQEDSLQTESVVSNQDKTQTFRDREETFTSIRDTSPAAHSTPVRQEETNEDNIHSSSFPSAVDTYTPTAQYHLPSTSPSAAPSHHQTLRSFHSPDRPPQVSSLLLGPSAGNSQRHTEFSRLASSERSDGMMGPASAPHQNQIKGTSATVQQQVSYTADNLQQLLLQQQMMQTQLLGLGSAVDAGALQRPKDKEQQQGECQGLQARVIQLEGEVKMLQLEREQSQMILENIQQRHRQDMQLLENTHKTRVKLLEESAAQRETRARLECEELMERLATLTRSAEQEGSELQAQYHRKLAQAQQDRDREVERLRDLQRKSILEMKKDHEDQLQRLKRLKDEEIDAVTSATSQTRSLTGVIEQMEQFSSRLGELSSRVESTHEHTAHGLEQGARHREEQLRSTHSSINIEKIQSKKDRLAQQQKAMAEERAYLKEIISRMDTQINEQQRQLEKERWKVTAEQAKAESAQRALEEERRVFTMQVSMEREELERAKTSLLEEQKSVMQHCAEERRKLAAEWAHFRTQEKQRHDKAEREVSSFLERREGSIISLAQEQADLKLRMAELKQKELAVTQEKETLARLREELDREKETTSSMALRLKTRAQEVEAFSKLAAERYEAGERALQESKRVESEHQARLRNIQSQTENLRRLEQQILKERMQIKHLQGETERLGEHSTISPLPQMIPPIFTDSVSVLPFSEPTSVRNNPSNSPTNYQSMTLEASLALWKYSAEKDREFLLEEQIFLENLKKKSNRFNTD